MILRHLSKINILHFQYLTVFIIFDICQQLRKKIALKNKQQRLEKSIVERVNLLDYGLELSSLGSEGESIII